MNPWDALDELFDFEYANAFDWRDMLELIEDRGSLCDLLAPFLPVVELT
jgi:hypothetical protein